MNIRANALLHLELEVQQNIFPIPGHDGGAPCPITTLDLSILEVAGILGVLHQLPCLFTYKCFETIAKDCSMISCLVLYNVKITMFLTQHGKGHLVSCFHDLNCFVLKAGTIPTLQSLRGVNGWLSYDFINTTIFKKNQKKIFQKKK